MDSLVSLGAAVKEEVEVEVDGLSEVDLEVEGLADSFVWQLTSDLRSQ